MKLRGVKSVIKSAKPVWPELEQSTSWSPVKQALHDETCECADCLNSEIEVAGTAEKVSRSALRFEFHEWKKAFNAFYEFTREQPKAGWCLVVSKHWMTSGYWIEKNACEDENARVFTSVAALKAYEQFVKHNLDNPTLLLEDTFNEIPAYARPKVDLKFNASALPASKHRMTQLPKQKKTKPPATLITSKPAPAAPVKRKIILED